MKGCFLNVVTIVAMIWQQHLRDNCDSDRWMRFSHCSDHNEISLFPVLKLVKLVPPFKGHKHCYPELFTLGHFPFVRTGLPDHGQTSLFENDIAFFQEVLLKKTHLLRAYYLGFD